MNPTQTIDKMMQRAKAKPQKKIDVTFLHEKAMEGRRNNILSVLYILFSEGYYSATNEKNIRRELCIEATLLNYLLLDYETTNSSETNALMPFFVFTPHVSIPE